MQQAPIILDEPELQWLVVPFYKDGSAWRSIAASQECRHTNFHDEKGEFAFSIFLQEYDQELLKRDATHQSVSAGRI